MSLTMACHTRRRSGREQIQANPGHAPSRRYRRNDLLSRVSLYRNVSMLVAHTGRKLVHGIVHSNSSHL